MNVISPNMISFARAGKAGGVPPYVFPDPEPVGVIYSKTLGDNMADWTQVGSSVTWTPNGTELDVSGSGGTGGTGASNLFKDYQLLNESGNDFNFTCLSKWKIRLKLRTPASFTGSTFGFGLGVISSNGFEEIDTIGRLGMSTGNIGYHFHYFGDTDATGVNNQRSKSQVALSTSTEYWFEVERDELTFTCRTFASNGTTLLNDYSFTETLTNVTYIRHNTGRFAISQFGGGWSALEIEISSDAMKNADFAFMGDSITYGGKASSLSNIWTEEFVALRAQGEIWENLGGWADRATELESRKEEVRTLNPKNIFIAVGSNDIKDGSWTSTGKQKVIDMAAWFALNTNATITLVNASARNDVNVTQVQTDMALMGYTVIDAFGVTKQPANSMLLGSLNHGDGIHGNDLFHDTVAAEANSTF